MSTLQKKVDDLEPWYHRIELEPNIFTGKPNPHLADANERWNKIAEWFPKSLSGMTVLDVGCNSGYFSMRCKKMGADKVTALDVTDTSIKQTKFVANHFNVDLEIIQSDILQFVLTRDLEYDYILFSRVFYHLKYPNLVFDRLAQMTKKRMIFLTDFLNLEIIPPPIENIKASEKEIFNDRNFPKMAFIEKSYVNDKTNWWIPNESFIHAMIRSSGMKLIAKPDTDMFICEQMEKQPKSVLLTDKLILPTRIEAYG